MTFLTAVLVIYWLNKDVDTNVAYITQTDIEKPSTLIVTAADYQTDTIPHNSVLLAYLMEGYKPTDAQFKELTHIAISFLQAANPAGDVVMTQGWDNLDDVITAAHLNNVKAIISFGGGGYKITSELMGNKKNRQNLIKNILKFMRKHKFDGFDCDWEPSWIDDKVEMESINNTLTHNYLIFIKEFREALDLEFGKGAKSFTAAIMHGNSIWYSPFKKISHFPKNGWWNYLDWIALMNYDNDLGAQHATFESVFGKDGSVHYWTKFGIPQRKIIIGIPFYGRGGWGEEWLFYKDIININPSIADTVDFITYNKNNSGEKEYGFNGTETITQKVIEVKKLKLPGIMFWRLAGDLPINHGKSLLKAMSKEFYK